MGQLGESSRDNLPGETEGVFDPTALRGLRSCLHELIPVFIHFILIRAVHVERDPLREAEVWTSVVAHEKLTANDELKFVLKDRADYEWARQLIEQRQLATLCPLLFSPVDGELSATTLADWLLADRLPVRFQLQLHKILWGKLRGR